MSHSRATMVYVWEDNFTEFFPDDPPPMAPITEFSQPINNLELEAPVKNDKVIWNTGPIYRQGRIDDVVWFNHTPFCSIKLVTKIDPFEPEMVLTINIPTP